jgi:tetratricopeptide (TPR) repeat protein
VRPATKLALEPLRADPRPALLMLGLPATVLGVTLAGLTLVAVRRLAARRAAARLGAAAGALALLLAVGAGGARAEPLPPEAQQDWNAALGAYLKDPMKQRGALRRLARRHGTDDLPTIYLMALADLNLRSSRERAAAELFARALEQSPEQPWAGWAEMALGGIATRQGDDALARVHFERAASPGSPTRTMALVTLGMTDAREGDVQGALARFEAVAATPGVSPEMRTAARLGAAYTRYWSADYDGAARAFRELADSGPPELLDDVLYGEARAAWAAGLRDDARTKLEALAGSAPGDDKPVSRALVDLRPEAVFRAGFEKYRRSPFTPGENLVTASFNGDGVALARAALRLLDPEAPPQPPMIGPGAPPLATTFRNVDGAERAAADPATAGPPNPGATAATGRAAPSRDAAPVAPGSDTRLMWIVAAAGALLAGLLVRRGSRRGGVSRSSRS